MSMTLQHSYEKQYEQMFKTYFAQLCYFAGKYIRDSDSCKEIVHKVFVNIWEGRDSFDFEKSPKSYLYTAVYNRCMNHLRDTKKMEQADSEQVMNMVQPNADHMQEAELEAHIWSAINSLPEKCKEVFVLNRFEEKKYAEIADMLGISIKTVETQMSKALKVMREKLSDYIHLFILLIFKWL